MSGQKMQPKIKKNVSVAQKIAEEKSCLFPNYLKKMKLKIKSIFQNTYTAPSKTQATLRSRSASLHSGHLTRDIRFGARLAPHSQFFFPSFPKKFLYS